MEDEWTPDEWTTVVNKKRPNKLKTTSSTKPKVDHVRDEYRRLTVQDYTLTEEENDVVNTFALLYQDQMCFIIHFGMNACVCCNTEKLTKLLHRPVYRCHRCYCCVPEEDDWWFDTTDMVCVYVNDATQTTRTEMEHFTASWEEYDEADKADQANQVFDDHKHRKLRGTKKIST